MKFHCRLKASWRGHSFRRGRNIGHSLTLLVLMPVAAVIVWGCTSNNGGGSSQYAEVCEGVPDCQTVSSDPVDAAGIRSVFIPCPSARPYVWDWGYQASATVHAWLESTVNDPKAASGPGGTIVVDTKGFPCVFTGSLACSSAPVEVPGIEPVFQESLEPPAMEKPRARPIR